MRIALDASYSVDPQPSGIAVYSREILSGLADIYNGDEFLHYYRPKQLLKSSRASAPNVWRRLLLWPFTKERSDLFHALNQRVEHRAGKRVLVTFHDLFVLTSDYSSAEFRARFAQQAKQAAELADGIIAVSQFTANQVSELLRIEWSRIRVVPHGVRWPGPLPPGEREKLVLFVGALQARKNLVRLIEAFESLPPEWNLVLAGSTRGYRAGEILDRIQMSGSRERIRVMGYVAGRELEQLYQRASIFAFPSLGEGFGIPVLEAMAHGIPVLTSNASSLCEVAGDAAVLVDPWRSEEIAAGLQQLASNEDLRCALAERGRLRAKQFPWERSVRETYAVYREFV